MTVPLRKFENPTEKARERYKNKTGGLGYITARAILIKLHLLSQEEIYED